MSAPMAVLHWRPGRDALTVAVEWPGAGAHTLYWGDGTSTPVPAARTSDAERAARLHTYAEPGTYDVVAITDDQSTASAQITVRDWVKPPPPGSSVSGNRVTLTFPSVSDPVRWRVDWGYNGEVSEHVGNTAEHTYPWNTDTPQITAMDVPSKRAVRFVGPSVGPAPDPDPDPDPSAPLRGFFLEHVSSGHDYRRIRLRGGGLKPGETVTWYPYSCAWYRDVVVDANGEISDEADWRKGVNWEFDDSWRSFTVSHSGGRSHVPYHGPHLENGTPDVVYDVHVDGDPQKVALSCYPVMIGWHTIDFGDGQTTRVHSATLPLHVEHRYAGSGPYNVTITLPDGRTAKGQVKGAFPCAPPHFNPNYPGRCSIGWNLVASSSHPACGDPNSGPYAPVVIDNGHHPPHRLHRPDNRTGWQVVYGYNLPVGRHTFRYSTFGKDTTTGTVNIAKAAQLYEVSDEIELLRLDDERAALTATFGEITEWDGGYSGTFAIHNHSEREVPGWRIEFVLDEPGVLREVWSDSGHARPQYSDLGGGRWRISAAIPIPGSTSVRVGARVEPPGNPRRFPDQITVTEGNNDE